MLSKSFKIQARLEELKKFIHLLVNNRQEHSLLNFACSEVGISFEELLPINQEEIISKFSTKEINDLRVTHMEARRKAKINILAKYILEHQLMNKSTSSSKLIKSNLTPQKVKLSESNYELDTERKVNNLKRAIFNELSVSRNLKQLKKVEEVKKKKIEEKIKEKESREPIKFKNLKLFELRDQRIKEILQKRKKEEEEHELKGLSYSIHSKSKEKILPFHSNNFISSTPQHQHTRSGEDIDLISDRLDTINKKLNKSAIRAKKLLLEKKMPAKQLANQIIKAKTLREQILNREEEEKSLRLIRIQNDLEFSFKRRELMREQKKLSRSLNSFKAKRIKEEESWIDLKIQENEKKNQIIDKIRKEVKESYSQRSQIISTKIALRKKDQEENLQKITNQKWREKDKLIEKIKEEGGIKKPEINIRSIRAEVKKMFLMNLKKNKV